MSEIDAIATALSARTSPGISGTLLTFAADDHWWTLTARLSPHLELEMPAPALRGLRLRLQLGAPTLLGHVGEPDPRWSIETDDRARAARLLDEPPWPGVPRRKLPDVSAALRGLGRLVLSIVTYGTIGPDPAGSPPTPRYILTVQDAVATIERRTSEIDEELAVGAAQRLIQLVLRTGRLEKAEAESARPRRGDKRGPYR